MESEEITRLKKLIDLKNEKLQIAKNALKDIADWNDDLEDKWDCPGQRVNFALKEINNLKP